MHINGATTMVTPIEQKIDNNLKVGNVSFFKVICELARFRIKCLHVGNSFT
jgi:hypothetical protein